MKTLSFAVAIAAAALVLFIPASLVAGTVLVLIAALAAIGAAKGALKVPVVALAVIGALVWVYTLNTALVEYRHSADVSAVEAAAAKAQAEAVKAKAQAEAAKLKAEADARKAEEERRAMVALKQAAARAVVIGSNSASTARNPLVLFDHQQVISNVGTGFREHIVLSLDESSYAAGAIVMPVAVQQLVVARGAQPSPPETLRVSVPLLSCRTGAGFATATPASGREVPASWSWASTGTDGADRVVAAICAAHQSILGSGVTPAKWNADRGERLAYVSRSGA